MKIFNFEIPYISELSTSILSGINVKLKRYSTDNKFAAYGIDSVTVINNIVRAIASFLPLFFIYSGILILCKTLTKVLGPKPKLTKPITACSTAIAFNYPL